MDLSPPLEARPPQRPTAKGHPNQEKRRTPSVKPVSHYKEMYRTLLEGVWLSEIRKYIPNEYLHSSKIFAEPHALKQRAVHCISHPTHTLESTPKPKNNTTLHSKVRHSRFYLRDSHRTAPAVRSFPARGTLTISDIGTDFSLSSSASTLIRSAAPLFRSAAALSHFASAHSQRSSGGEHVFIGR